MTIALKRAMESVGKLPAVQQNAIASLLLEEAAWQKSFTTSQDTLAMLASEAEVEYKSGKTKPMNLK